jgi:hypothetical protein
LTVALVLLTAVIFRAGTLDAAQRIFEGLSTMPDLSRLRRLSPIFIGMLIAFLFPASQDFVAWLTKRPRSWVALLLGIAVLAILIPVGDREANEFIYFQF